jgi:uncharacterized membrane protein
MAILPAFHKSCLTIQDSRAFLILFQVHVHFARTQPGNSSFRSPRFERAATGPPAGFNLKKGDPVPEETVQSGLSDNAAGALAYVTIIPAIIFLIVAPYNTNSYIRFHSWQSIFLGICAFVIGFINVIPILGQIIFLIGMLALFVAWIIVLLKALKGERYKLPIIGNLAEKQAGN